VPKPIPIPRARTRANRPNAKGDVRDERVSFVRHVMASGQWRTKMTPERLAKKWGLHVDTVFAIAAEAARQMRQATEIAETLVVRESTIARIERLSHKAEKEGDLRTAVRAEAEKAKIAGLVRSEPNVVVLVSVGGAEVKASVDELRAMIGRVDTFLRERHPSVARELAAHIVEAKA
jgi:hypothetical protein